MKLISNHITLLLYITAYVQTTGRGGRDGGCCTATLHYNNEDLGRPNVTKEVKDFCRLTTCRRVYLCDYFGTTTAFDGPPHSCCDNCSMTCECCQDSETFEDQDMSTNHVPHNATTERLIYCATTQVFNATNKKMNTAIDPKLLTGLTTSLALDVATNYEMFASEDVLALNYFYIEPRYIKVIFRVLHAFGQH